MNKPSSDGKIIVNSIIYSCSGLLLKCFSFFLLPLYTSYLSTQDYGIISVATSFISTMSFVVAFSLFSAIKRFYVEYQNDEEKLSRFYGTICVFVFLSGIVYAMLGLLFRNALSIYIFSGIDFYPVILVCIISLIFECQHTIFDRILRSQQRALKASISSILYFFITLSGNILFVVVFKMGAIGSLLATATGYLLYSIYFVVEMLVNKKIKICLDIELLKKALKYSIPIMPHNLSTHIAVLISKVLIGDSSSMGSLGVYSVAAQFGNLADTVQSYVSQAYGPWLFEKLHAKANGYRDSIQRISNILSAVVGLFLLGIALFAQDYILLLIDPSYVGAWHYVPMIVLIFGIKTIYYFYVEVLFYYQKASRLLFTATVTGSVLNVLLSYVMIPLWGAYVSILADAIAMIVRVVIIVHISLKYDNIGLRIRDFIINYFIVVVFIFAGLFLSYMKYANKFSWINLCYKVSIVILYMGMLFVRYHKEIIEFIYSVKNKIWRKDK